MPDGSHVQDTRPRPRWLKPTTTGFGRSTSRLGPDGAVYLADWYDVRLTHVDPRDNWDRSNGRIYRVTAPGAGPIKPFDLSKLSSDALIGMLSHSNKWFRQQSLRLLGDRRDASVIPKLARLVETEKGQLALETLWALNLSGGFTDAFALRQLSHPDELVRMWTVRLLGDAKRVSDDVHKRLIELARYERDAQVRSQLASSARRWPGSHGLPVVHELLQRGEDLGDPHIPLLLWWAIENKAVSDRPRVLAMFNHAAAWQQPMIARHIMPRLTQRYAAEGTEADLAIVAQLIENAPNPAERERLLTAVGEAFKGRQIENIPPALRQAIAGVGGKADPKLVMLKLRLGAASAQDAALALKLIRNDEEKTQAQRIEFIQALGDSRQPDAIAPLLHAARNASSHSVRRAALRALQAFDDPQIGREILTAYSTLPADQGVRPQAIDVLSKRPAWAVALLREVEAKKIKATDVPFEVIERIKLHKDSAIAPLVQKLWGHTRQTPKELQQRMAAVAKVVTSGQGDSAAGKQLFTTACAACHKLHGEGQTIGPDLTGYERDNLDFLLLAIVDPNAGLREEYTNFELETTDGLLLTGYIIERAAQSVTIEDGLQGRVIVPKSKIKSLQASATSRMPEGLLDALNEQQVRDLFGYLRSKGPVAAKR